MYHVSEPDEEHAELFIEASKLMENQSYNEALVLFQELQENIPDIPELHFNKSVIYFQLEEYEESLECINDALELNPDSANYVMLKFNILYELRRIENAISTGKKIFNLLDHVPIEIYEKLGLLTYMNKDNDQSIKYLQKAYNSGSKRYQVIFTLAILEYQRSNYTKSIELLEECLENYVTEEDLVLYLINACRANNDLQKAKDIVEELSENERTDRIQFELSKLNKEIGNLDQANKIIDLLLNDHPENKKYLIAKANILRESGKYKEAIEYYDKILKDEKEYIPALKGKALSLLELDETVEANILFERGQMIKRKNKEK